MAAPPTGEPATAPAVLRKASRNRGNIRKRPVADEAAESGADSAGDDGIGVMRPPKAPKIGALAFSTKQTGDDQVRPFKFASSRTVQQTTDQGATATLETETQFDRDARQVLMPISADMLAALSFRFASDEPVPWRRCWHLLTCHLRTVGRCERRCWRKPIQTLRRPGRQTAPIRASTTTPITQRHENTLRFCLFVSVTGC